MKYVWSGFIGLVVAFLVQPVSAETIKVFILAGQSNMEGFGRIGNDDGVEGTLPWVVAQQYEESMTTFIEDIRNDLHRDFGSAPDLPFVIASSGFNGFTSVSDPWQKRLQDYVAPAQLAAAEKTENCLGVDTRPFYRIPAQSPRDAVYHWNFSAESYFRIGYDMAEAMKKLLPRNARTQVDHNL